MSYQFTGYSSTPTTPQTPIQWDGGDAPHLEQQVLHHPLQQQQQQQQQQQPQPQQPAEMYTTPSPSTIQIQEFVPVVPSHDSNRQRDHARHPQQIRPHIQVDTRQMRVGTSTTPPSGPPSAGTYQGPGPERARAMPSFVDARMVAHPYRRPQSAGTGTVRPRREYEDVVQSVRSQRHVSVGSMPAPTTAPTRLPPYLGTASATTSLISPAHAVNVPPENRKFIIRTDVHYDSETHLLSASLELPGLKKSDISIVLSTCYYNGVKQVVVSGRARPVFPSKGYAVRERKYGEFTRTLVVASETKPEDITAEMQDGILTIKIRLPPFPEGEPIEHEITVQ